MKPLYKGIWAKKLERGQDLPIIRGKLDEELANLNLDFDSFPLDDWSPDAVFEAYREDQETKEVLKKALIGMDPYLFFICNKVCEKVRTLFDLDSEHAEDLEEVVKSDGDKIKLSDMKGRAGPAEQAVLGQYLLQQVFGESVYMSGIECQQETKRFAYSLLVLKDNDETYFFDISRPMQSNLPRILVTDIPLTYELFEDEDSLLVGATEVLHCGRMFFGVGDPTRYK